MQNRVGTRTNFQNKIWYGKGNGRLLLANDNEQKFTEGDVVRFEAGDIPRII